MDSLEVNKAFAAVLVAGIVFSVGGVVGGLLVHPARLEKTAIKIEGVPAAGTTEAPPVQDPPVEALLASADPEKGHADTQKLCTSCHTFNEGGKAGVGPNLYGVVGLKHGHMEGFSYSSAITAKQGPWTFDELYEWLKSPRTYAPGTKMSFAGIDNPKERADVIAYLNSNSAHPEALPAPPPAAKAEAAKAAPDAAANSNVAARQPGVTSGAAGQGGAQPAGSGTGSANGQMSQPSQNQNMPAAAAAQAEQPPNATSVVTPNSNQSGAPQPDPAAKSP